MKVTDILEHFLSRADWIAPDKTVDRVIAGDPNAAADFEHPVIRVNHGARHFPHFKIQSSIFDILPSPLPSVACSLIPAPVPVPCARQFSCGI